MRLLLLLLTACVAMGYTTPPGIPQPMWGAVDPITVAKPAQPGTWPSAEAAGYYYIDNTDPAATDTANTYGYPAKPRLTIPETTYAAGSYCEIHGGPYIRVGGDAEQDIVCTGTEANPCWFVGTSNTVRPELRGNLEVSGTYIIMQWLKSSYDPANTRANAIHIGGDPDLASYVCLRHCTSQGDGTFHSGFSAGIAMNGLTGAETNNIVFYGCEMLDNNSYTYALTTEDDNHGLQIGFYTNNVWVLDCDMHDNSGDAIQISGNNATGEARSQYVYIGDCRMYRNSENAVDIKSSLDVVISRNQIYTYAAAGGSDGAAIVVQQEGGDGCDYVWALFNHFYDCRRVFRAEEVVTNVYFIGNLAHDCGVSTLASVYFRTSGTSVSVVDNTFADLAGSVIAWDGNGGVAPTVNLHGNLMSTKPSANHWIDGDATTQAGTSNYNLFDAVDDFRVAWEGGSYTTLASYQAGKSEDANSIDGTVGLTAPASDQYALTSASNAIAASIEHGAYAAFLARYSLSIAADYLGNTRPQGGTWDIGAMEFVDSGVRKSNRRRAGSMIP